MTDPGAHGLQPMLGLLQVQCETLTQTIRWEMTEGDERRQPLVSTQSQTVHTFVCVCVH